MSDSAFRNLVIPTGGRSREAWIALIEDVERRARFQEEQEEGTSGSDHASPRERLLRALEESGVCPPPLEQMAARMQQVEARQRARALVLERVYEQAKGQAETWVDLWGLSLDEVEDDAIEAAAAYLTATGLTRRDQSRDWDTLALTSTGVDYAEARLLSRAAG